MKVVFERPKSLQPTKPIIVPFAVSIVNRLIAEVIDEFDIQDRTVGIAPVGCGVFVCNYFS